MTDCQQAGAAWTQFVDSYPGISQQSVAQQKQQQGDNGVFNGMTGGNKYLTAGSNFSTGVAKGIAGVLGLGDNSNESSVSTSILNDIAADIVADIVTNCEQSTDLTQRIELNCNGDGDTRFEENAGCKACTDMWNKIPLNRANLEAAAVARDPHYNHNIASRQAPATLTGSSQALFTNKDFWPCLFACRQCGFYDFAQTAVFKVDQLCVTATDMSNMVQSQFKAKVQQYLRNQQDALGQLSGFLSGGNRDCIASDIAHRMSSRFTTNVAQTLITRMNAVQQIRIGDQSKSIWGNKWAQVISANTISSLISQQKIFNGMYSEAEIANGQKLISKNDTIGDLANSLLALEEGLSKVFSSIVGKALIILGVLVFGMVMIFAIMMASSKKLRQRMLTKVSGEE